MHLARLLGWHYDWLAAAWGEWLWVTRAIWVRRWWWDGSQLHARVEMQLTLVREESAPPSRVRCKDRICLKCPQYYSLRNP